MTDIKPDKIFFNYRPGVTSQPDNQRGGFQDRVDGNFLNELSVGDKAFRSTVNIDKVLIAGEDINVGQPCGMWGKITQTDSAIIATQATYVDSGVPDTVKDGTNPILTKSSGPTRNALLFFPSLDANEPSGTGVTILTREIRITLDLTVNSGSNQLRIFENNQTFDETTATWNTGNPSSTELADPVAYAGTEGTGYLTSGWLDLTSSEYDEIVAKGMTLKSNTGNHAFRDEDQTNKPVIEVRFTYEVQNDEIFLSSGLTEKYANGFRGFAQNSVLKGESVKYRIQGVDKNQTGLTVHSDYELSDTAGSIQTGTTATWDKVVAVAISATEIQINYNLSDAAQI